MKRRTRASVIAALPAVLLGIAAIAASHSADQSARPKIYSIAYVRFKSVDREKSRAFYAKILGLKTDREINKVGINPFSINAHQHLELTPANANDRGSFLEEVAFNVSDLDAMHAYLSAHGFNPGVITSDITRPRWFAMDDPEHNRIAFVELSGRDAQVNNPLQISNRLLHAGWVVHDLDTERKFYSDVLGFRLYWYGGFKDADIDWYELQVPDGDNWVEFMLNIPANADHKELGVQNHFSLGVASAKEVASQLRNRGLQIFAGPEIGRDGKNSLDAYDPDGNRVEVMEFAPAQTPCCHPYQAAHPIP